MSEDDDQAARLDAEGNLHLGRRCIPLPSSVSAEARRMLAMPRLETGAAPGSGCHPGVAPAYRDGQRLERAARRADACAVRGARADRDA